MLYWLAAEIPLSRSAHEWAAGVLAADMYCLLLLFFVVL